MNWTPHYFKVYFQRHIKSVENWWTDHMGQCPWNIFAFHVSAYISGRIAGTVSGLPTNVVLCLGIPFSSASCTNFSITWAVSFLCMSWKRRQRWLLDAGWFLKIPLVTLCCYLVNPTTNTRPFLQPLLWSRQVVLDWTWWCPNSGPSFQIFSLFMYVEFSNIPPGPSWTG